MEADNLPAFTNDPEFQELQALSKAMMEADIAGLKLPANARTLEDIARLSPEEKIALHRHAVAQKKAKDQRNLEFHRKAFELLYLPGERGAWVKAEALKMIQKWEDRKLCNPRYAHTWRQWLDLPADYGKKQILREDDLGVSMRCNTPLKFLAIQPARTGEVTEPAVAG